MKHTVSERALTLVEGQLKKLDGTVTPQDAAAATGLTVMEAQDALTRLMELYVTRVGYNDQGRILFTFDQPLRERGTKTVKEQWAAVREKFWRAFKVFYKVWIAVVMIGYFVLMAVLLLLLMLAASRSDDDDDRGPGAIGGLLHMLSEGLRYAFLTHAYSGGYVVDTHGYRYREAKVPGGRGKHDKKSFIVAVYDFALGPERAETDPLENEKEAAEFLQREKGVLTTAEVLALSGGDFSVAEERMADYMARFGGEPRLTEEGVVVGEFVDFLERSSSETSGAAIVPFWEEYEPPYEVTGNSAGRNFIIALMAVVTLFGGLILGPGGYLETLAYAYHPAFDTGLARFFLGYMPIAFGLTYLALPLVRSPFVKAKERERLRRSRKKQLMRAIFLGRLWRTDVDSLYDLLPDQTKKELSLEQVGELLGELALDLQGDLELDPNGRPIYSFPRLEREYAAAEMSRTGRLE